MEIGSLKLLGGQRLFSGLGHTAVASPLRLQVAQMPQGYVFYVDRIMFGRP